MKKSVLFLIVVMMVSIFVGCNSNMPDDFTNNELYSDLAYLLESVSEDKSNIKNMEGLSNNEKYNKSEQDLMSYENDETLNDKEKEALSAGWDLIVGLELYDEIPSEITKSNVIIKIEDLMAILGLNVEI